jgi:hypothetical protein
VNDLLAMIDSHGLTHDEAMNQFQNAGLISDNCERLLDICESDAKRATRWLESRPKPKRARE